MARGRISIILAICIALVSSTSCFALGSSQTPQSGPLGLEATIPSSPPTIAPTVATPSNGQSFSSIPVTVSGLCSSNMLTKIFNNKVFVGSTVCANGSYSIKVDLFNGVNDLYAQDFDALNQGSPVSNSVTASFVSSAYTQPGAQVVVTSSYGELGANPGDQLSWPIDLGGGTPPYAISVDWGDGQAPTLQSSASGGKIYIKHTYSTSGGYNVSVTVTDNNGVTGFLQLVGIANGQIAPAKSTNNKASQSSSRATFPWWELLIIVFAMVPAFWLGSRHGRSVLLRKYTR